MNEELDIVVSMSLDCASITANLVNRTDRILALREVCPLFDVLVATEDERLIHPAIGSSCAVGVPTVILPPGGAHEREFFLGMWFQLPKHEKFKLWIDYDTTNGRATRHPDSDDCEWDTFRSTSNLVFGKPA